MKSRGLLVGVLVALFGLAGAAQAPAPPPGVPYDHIHLAVPDPDKAAEWYVRNLDGQVGENPGRVTFEPFGGPRPGKARGGVRPHPAGTGGRNPGACALRPIRRPPTAPGATDFPEGARRR